MDDSTRILKLEGTVAALTDILSGHQVDSIDGEEIKELKGVGGSTVAVVFKMIPIRIGEREFKVKVAWCLKEDVPALLGRRDIFDNFHVLFKQDEKVIEFEETEK